MGWYKQAVPASLRAGASAELGCQGLLAAHLSHACRIFTCCWLHGSLKAFTCLWLRSPHTAVLLCSMTAQKYLATLQLTKKLCLTAE